MSRDTSNAPQLAKLLNLTVQQCYNLANSGTIPKAEGGQWNLTQCAHAYIKYLQSRSGDEKRDFAAERTRKTRLEADILELEKAQLAGQLIPVDQVQAAWGRLAAAFRARMLALPTETAPLVVAADSCMTAEKILTDAIHDALNELSGDELASRVAGQFDASDGGGKAAAEPDHQPVGG